MSLPINPPSAYPLVHLCPSSSPGSEALVGLSQPHPTPGPQQAMAALSQLNLPLRPLCRATLAVSQPR